MRFFWAGDERTPEPSYYSYTAPEPADLTERPLATGDAAWAATWPTGSLALLPYDAGRTAANPAQARAGLPPERIRGLHGRGRLGPHRPGRLDGLGRDDPDRAVAALHALGAATGIGEPDLKEDDLVAVELAIGARRPDNPNVSCQARTWLWTPGPAATSRPARSRRPRNGRPRSRPPPAVGRRDHRPRPARALVEAARPPPPAASPRVADIEVVVLDRLGSLREDVAGVELGVHAMPREAPLVVAIT